MRASDLLKVVGNREEMGPSWITPVFNGEVRAVLYRNGRELGVS